MSAPRLYFLYPPLWPVSRSPGPPRSLSRRVSRHCSRPCNPSQLVSPRSSRCQSTIPQRHGTAVEHIPQSQPGLTRPPKPGRDAAKEVKEGPTGGDAGQSSEAPQVRNIGSNAGTDNVARASPSSTKKGADTLAERVERRPADTKNATNGGPSNSAPTSDAAIKSEPQPSSGSTALQAVTEKRPLETVLHLESPSRSRSEDRRKTPPHLEPAPYVHHFDTYTLVKDLGKGGFTDEQAVTIMKAIRSLLAVNLDLAKDGLVSKSNVENVCRTQAPFCNSGTVFHSNVQRARRLIL